MIVLYKNWVKNDIFHKILRTVQILLKSVDITEKNNNEIFKKKNYTRNYTRNIDILFVI